MDSDKVTTITGAVTAAATGGAALTMVLPQIDPALLALIPPPYNLYVMLGLIGVGALSHIIQTYMTNKRVITATSDMKESTPGK